MTDEEMTAAIEAAVETATEKLKAKNTDLIREVRDLKAGKKTAEEEADDAKADAERRAGDTAALEKRLTDKFAKERASLEGERDTALSELKTIKIDNVITKSLVDNGYADWSYDAMTAKFKAGAIIENGEAVYEGKSLAEAVKAHASSAAGQHFVTAPNNTGGGAAGSKVTNGDRWSKLSSDPSQWSQQDYSDFAQLSKSDPGFYNATVAQKGLPDSFKV